MRRTVQPSGHPGGQLVVAAWLALALLLPARADGQTLSGALVCSVVDGSGTTTHPMPFVSIAVDRLGTTSTAPDGRFTLPLAAGTSPASVHLTVSYRGAVTTPGSAPGTPAVGSPLQVVDDVFAVRSDARDQPVQYSSGNGDLGTVTLDTPDCELWRIGARVLDDYHQVAHASPPAGGFKILRPVGVVILSAYTFYDYVRVRTDLLSYEPQAEGREQTLFHEFGHTLRHVLDGDINHWNCDDFRWAYGRTHCGNEVFNMQYAFNEGWAGYWHAARRLRLTTKPDRLAPSGGCAPPPGPAGSTDWVEIYVTNALLDADAALQRSLGIGADQSAAAMLEVLRSSPRQIHSLYAFRRALAARMGAPAPPEPAPCPAGYTNDGLTCRKDVVVVSKPSQPRGVGTPPKGCGAGQQYDAGLCYPICRDGYGGVGPVCWGTCPAGYHDDGATCRKDAVVVGKASYGRGAGTVPTGCGAGKERDAGLCYPSCKPGYHGVGPVCWGTCPDGYHDDGATCRRDAHIISADNSSCPWYDKCGLTFAKGCSTCPGGYHNDGCTCRIDVDIRAKGTYGRGVGVAPTGCAPGAEYAAGLCYPACASGYHGVGPVCWGACPAGYRDDGATCRRDVSIVAKSSYGRGAGTVPTDCGAGKELDAGLCYPTCNPGFHGVGPVCWGACPVGFDDHGATCYVGTSVLVRGGACNFEPWTYY